MTDGWIKGGEDDAFAYKKDFVRFSFEIPKEEDFMKTLLMIWRSCWLDPRPVATCFTYEPLMEEADRIAGVVKKNPPQPLREGHNTKETNDAT